MNSNLFSVVGMYWYQLSNQEEDFAWRQAEAQSEAGSTVAPAKFIGNVGEIAVNAFFQKSIENDGSWEYENELALLGGEPEFNDYDFTIDELTIDVKSTSDVRKFNPVEMADSDYKDGGWSLFQSMHRDEGYSTIDAETDTDVFIFVLVNSPADPPPAYAKLEDKDREEWSEYEEEALSDRSGNNVAIILGWMFAAEFFGEAMNNVFEVDDQFTRVGVRDMYELLLRSATTGVGF